MQWRRRERGKEMVVLGLVMGTRAGFVHPRSPRIRLFSNGRLAQIEPMAQPRRPTPSKWNWPGQAGHSLAGRARNALASHGPDFASWAKIQSWTVKFVFSFYSDIVWILIDSLIKFEPTR
jgi:hypothetical protein